MIYEILQEHMGDSTPPVFLVAAVALLICLGIFTLSSTFSGDVLPGVPRLRGYPVLGAIPIYFRDGMALMLEALAILGDDGIAYAQVGNKTLVSVHDPVMAKEVLSFTDDVASRLVHRLGSLDVYTDIL